METHHHVPWFTLLCIVLAGAVFYSSSPERFDSAVSLMMESSGSAVRQNTNAIIPKAMQINPGVPSAPIAEFAEYDRQSSYSGGTPDVTDTREFLKTSYNANMKTREVQELTRRAETTVRGFDGRVDSTSSSPKSGYVNFVVPAEKFEEFRTEVETFVPPRFLSVQVQSYNKLGEKQNIEAAQENVETSLATLEANRKELLATHAQTIASFSRQINDVETEMAALYALAPTQDASEASRRSSRLNSLSYQLSQLEARRDTENARHKSSLASIDQQKKYVNQNLTGVKEQDQRLLDDVATVSGTISIQWISLWGMDNSMFPQTSSQDSCFLPQWSSICLSESVRS